MSDIKDQMIEAVERGWTTDDQAYDYVRESLTDGADRARKISRERPVEEDLRSEIEKE